MENHKNGISPEGWFSTALLTDFFQVLTIVHRRQWKGFFFCFSFVSFPIPLFLLFAYHSPWQPVMETEVQPIPKRGCSL
jgi:hypothetical protein